MKKIVDVSILATNYNNGKYLDDFFQSIIALTVIPRQLVFVDDGSTDNSVEVIKKYQKLPFLELLIFDKNRGRAEALNKGKKQCFSKYILMIDPDDIMLPKRLEQQFLFMESNPEIAVCGGNVLYFNSETGKILNKSNFPQKNILNIYRKGENGVLQPTVIIKNKIIKKYEYKQIVPGQDYEFFARIINDGYLFKNLPDILNKMRIHQKSAVSNLTFNSIKNIFYHRDKIFKTHSSFVKIYLYFLHLKFYRKGMLSTKKILKLIYYFISLICYPKKIINRIFS